MNHAHTHTQKTHTDTHTRTHLIKKYRNQSQTQSKPITGNRWPKSREGLTYTHTPLTCGCLILHNTVLLTFKVNSLHPHHPQHLYYHPHSTPTLAMHSYTIPATSLTQHLHQQRFNECFNPTTHPGTCLHNTPAPLPLLNSNSQHLTPGTQTLPLHVTLHNTSHPQHGQLFNTRARSPSPGYVM